MATMSAENPGQKNDTAAFISGSAGSGQDGVVLSPGDAGGIAGRNLATQDNGGALGETPGILLGEGRFRILHLLYFCHWFGRLWPCKIATRFSVPCP